MRHKLTSQLNWYERNVRQSLYLGESWRELIRHLGPFILTLGPDTGNWLCHNIDGEFRPIKIRERERGGERVGAEYGGKVGDLPSGYNVIM